MAIPANTVWEVRTTGNDGNGGGFVTGASGTDYSQQDAAQAVLTVASVVHTTTTQINVAPGDHTVSANDVGNILQITGGTATAGFYQITVADVANNRWTTDKIVGAAGATVVGSMGGAMASPARIGVATAVQNGNIIYIKSGTYSMSVNTDNVSNGKWNKAAAILVIGYNTNRTWGNTDTRPIIQATVTLTSMWSGSSNWLNNIELDANSQAATRCINAGVLTRCRLNNATLTNASIGLATHCTATGNSGIPFVTSGGAFYYCEAYGNTAAGFSCQNANVVGCLSYGNTGASSDGFLVPVSGSAHFFNCIAYNNSRDGFRTSSGGIVSRMILENCISESNGAIGINSLGGTFYPSLAIRCSTYNNTTSGVGGDLYEVAALTPAGSVFTNAAAADFSLNNTAGTGAALRAAGYIDLSGNTYPRGLTTSYLDVGAAQHQDTGGGGGEHSAVF